MKTLQLIFFFFFKWHSIRCTWHFEQSLKVILLQSMRKWCGFVKMESEQIIQKQFIACFRSNKASNKVSSNSNVPKSIENVHAICVLSYGWDSKEGKIPWTFTFDANDTVSCCFFFFFSFSLLLVFLIRFYRLCHINFLLSIDLLCRFVFLKFDWKLNKFLPHPCNTHFSRNTPHTHIKPKKKPITYSPNFYWNRTSDKESTHRTALTTFSQWAKCWFACSTKSQRLVYFVVLLKLQCPL